MRVTPSMYYDNLYGANNVKLNRELFDVNKQIASGLQIQYASDNIRTFTETMRLDNELSTIAQVKKSTESGYKVSNQTDITLNEFTDSMNRMRVLIIQASNGSNSDLSLDAISLEMRGIEKNLKSLANTSINGKYLFAGTAVDEKPISSDGTYNGNGAKLEAFLGSNNKQAYNLSGADLFLGQEASIKREITTNIIQESIVSQNETIQAFGYVDKGNLLSVDSTIRDMMGDTDKLIDITNSKSFFYIRGVKSDGNSFNTKIKMKDSETVADLLTQIGNAYGNNASNSVVKVSLNDKGEIVIVDKQKGSSKLDFNMIGAIDYNSATGTGGAADVTDIDDLDAGTTDYATAANGTVTVGAPAAQLYIKEFNKSPYTNATGAATNISGILYDRTMFSVSGNTVYSNIPQINNTTNAFATPSTKLLDTSSGTTLNNKQFTLAGTNVNGTAFTAQIDFATGGSTFSLDGGTTNYNIYNMDSTRAAVDSDKMTYQQLMDVMNMIVTNNIPATTTSATNYDNAIKTSNTSGVTTLSNDGIIKFGDLNVISTKATISLFDANSGDFTQAASVMAFNANSALTVRDPKTDFFKTINETISAVEEYKLYPDSSSGNMRNAGMSNAITMIDDLQAHVSRTQSVVGAQSNRLTKSLERTQLVEISTITLRSSIIDTDLAEATLRMQQLTLNYQAMLSTVGKVAQLSLVNYL